MGNDQQFALPPGATPADTNQSQPPVANSQQQFPLPAGATPAGAYTPDGAPTGNGGDQDPATANGQGGDPISGGVAEGAADVAKPIVQAVTHPISTIWHMLPPVQLADSTKQLLSVINAYERERSSGKSIPDAIQAADIQARQQDAVVQQVQQRVAEFKKNPTQESVRALTDVAALAASIWGGGGAAAEGAEAGEAASAATDTSAAADTGAAADTEAATTAPAQPQTLLQKGKELFQSVKQGAITKGADVAQPEAQSALRTGAQDAAEDSGVADQVTLQPNQGIRTLADDSIGATKTAERGLYDKINEAAGTDLKTHYEKLANINDAIDASVDPAEEARLELARTQRTDTIADAEAQAVKNGVDPSTLKQAEALTQQRYALQDVKAKLFNNEGVVKGNVAHGAEESVNVDSAITQAEKLNKPSKFAPEGSPTRLEQALGKQGASNLLKNLYAAQKTGAIAVRAQRIALWLGGATGSALLGYHELTK